MKNELITPAAILAAAVIDKMEKQQGDNLKISIAEAFTQAYRGLELAERAIQQQDLNGNRS